uniref:Uncharacterized protein n=1 Tax=viral metagenome TaxID=1070528 RepID=A0A6M3KS53_9ZZZZ
MFYIILKILDITAAIRKEMSGVSMIQNDLAKDFCLSSRIDIRSSVFATKSLRRRMSLRVSPTSSLMSVNFDSRTE